MREAIRFLLAPLPAAVLAGCISVATGAFPRLVSIILFMALLLYAAQLVVGIPVRMLLARRGHVSAAAHAIGGFAMTAIPVAPYMAWSMARNGYPFSSMAMIFWLMGCYGALTGLFHWLLARPDRRAPPSPRG